MVNRPSKVVAQMRNKIKYYFLFMSITLIGMACSSEKEQVSIVWDNSLELPPCDGMEINKGLASAFAGVLDNELILVGGANFPHAYPWDGGTKVWWSTLYKANIKDNESANWEVKENFLDKTLAYGVSIQLSDKIICIGGSDNEFCYADVFAIVKNENGEIVISEDSFPSLPVPLANAAGAIYGNKIFLAGGQETMLKEKSTNHFFCLDLSRMDQGWISLPSWQGPSRAYSVCQALNGKVFLFSGRSFGPEETTIMHDDAYAYDINLGTWEKLTGKYPVMAGSSVLLGEDKILLLGGVREILPTTPDHPGFSRKILVFNTVDYTLGEMGESPYPIPVTCHSVPAGNSFYIASGEVRPGVRTPNILKGTTQ